MMTATERIYNLQSRFCRKCTSLESREACPYCVVERAVQQAVVEETALITLRGFRSSPKAGDGECQTGSSKSPSAQATR